MKKVILAALLVMSTTTVFAKDGNEGGGGGSLTPATSQQVKSELKYLLDDGRIGDYLILMMYAINSIQDAQVQDILTKVNQAIAASPKYQQLWQGKYLLKTDGACKGSDGAKQASVSANQPNSTICYSLPLLTKIPAVQLRSSLVALTAHEISHQYGADESVAKKFESAFSGFALQIWRLASIDRDLSNIQTSAAQRVDWLKKNSPELSSSNICYEFGQIVGRATIAQAIYTDLDASMGHSETADYEFYKSVGGNAMELTALCKLNTAATFNEKERIAFANYFQNLAKTIQSVRATLPFKGPN